MGDSDRIFRAIVADLVVALRVAASAHDDAATEAEEDWLRILLEECARDRRRLATALERAVAPWALQRLVASADATPHDVRWGAHAIPRLADVLSARAQTASAISLRDAEVERQYALALVHQPSRELGELLRRQADALASSRGKMSGLRRRDRLTSRG